MTPDTGAQLMNWLVPLFLLIMFVEWLGFLFAKRSVYSLSDTLANLACGAGQAVFDSLVMVGLLFIYNWLQQKLGIVAQELSFERFFFAFVFVDLTYYVYHRLSHKIPWMWAVHVAHHSSDHYNFSVGLRQAWFHKLTAFPFYLLLIFTGLNAATVGLVIATHAALQLLTHTQAIKKEIPVLRWIFVTPSHHRVHHGLQPQYLDKNFSGIFSVWDRLFRSYEPEVEPVVFGISPQLKTHNPWNINTHFWKTLFPRSRLFSQLSGFKKISAKNIGVVLLFILLFISTFFYLQVFAKVTSWPQTLLAIVLLVGYSIWGRYADSLKK